MPPLQHYRELLQAWPQLTVACCITWVEPGSLARFLTRVGTEARSAGELSLPEAVERVTRPTSPGQLALVGDADGWVVGIEPYGFQGSRFEVLRALSGDNGRAVSVFWNVNMRYRLGYARDGQVLASLDPLARERRGRQPDALQPYLDGLAFAEDEQAAALTLAERITGVQLDGDWLAAHHPAVLISPLPADVIPDGYHNHPALADAELRAIIENPLPEDLPRLTTLAAELVADHAGLRAEPLVIEMLDMLRGGRPFRRGLADELAALARDYERRCMTPGVAPQQAQHVFHQWQALLALTGALEPDPGQAAWKVCFLARSAVGGNFDHQLRLVVLNNLVDRAVGSR